MVKSSLQALGHQAEHSVDRSGLLILTIALLELERKLDLDLILYLKLLLKLEMGVMYIDRIQFRKIQTLLTISM